MDQDIDVVVIGDLNADLILRGDVVPTFGQAEQLLNEATLTIGSSAAIFACGAARLGLKVALIAKVGSDLWGRYLLGELTARGIDTTGCVIDPSLGTGVTVILAKENDRAMLTYTGAMAKLHFDEINPEHVRRARHLHLASFFLLDALRPDVPRLCELAHATGCTISLDTNDDPSRRWDSLVTTLEQIDVFLPNDAELQAITGINDVALGLETLVKQVPTVAVKCGKRGALATQNQFRCAAMPPIVTTVDAVGAGDTFDAGFVYGFLKKWDLQRTLEFACVCGALSTRAAGGTAAQPTCEEALVYLVELQRKEAL